MAVVARVATIVMSGATGSRTFQATAVTQDTGAGSSVVVTVTNTTTGASPPGGPGGGFTLEFRNDAGGVIRSVALGTAAASQDVTFFFTSTGLSGGSARVGTVEIVLHAVRTASGTYDVETDGSPNTPPIGFTTTQLDRGWIRGTTAGEFRISNVGAGVDAVNPVEYDESLYIVISKVSGSSYIARAQDFVLTHGSLSGTTNSGSGASQSAILSNVVDDRFAAALTTGVGRSSVTVPNATLTGQPDWVFTSWSLDQTLNVDPRLTIKGAGGANGWHFQVNRASFDTSYFDSTKQMLTSDSGQAAARFVGSRGTGINGLTVTLTADPTNPGTTITSAGVTTATLDSEAGWTPLIDVCPTGKPGGVWTLSADVTAPNDIEGDTYIVNATDTITVVADDPSLQVRFEGGNPASPDDHWRPGQQLIVGGVAIRVSGAISSEVLTRLAADADSAIFTLASFNYALGRLETLKADKTGFEYTSTPAKFRCAASPGDALLQLYTFTDVETAQWGSNRGAYFIEGFLSVNGIRKAGGGKVDGLGIYNLHNDSTDMATQAELNTHAALDKSSAHPGTIENADIALATITENRLAFDVATQDELDAARRADEVTLLDQGRPSLK